jgi:Spy/CpxP family protein refolding chaperone
MNPDTRRRAGLWLALVFLLGAAVGVVFGYSFGHWSYASTKVATPALTEGERQAKRVADMSKEIGLNGEQSTKLEGIIHNTHEEMKAIHTKSDAEVDAVREKARDEIRQFLTPEQKAKFEVMVQRMDAQRKQQKQVAEK